MQDSEKLSPSQEKLIGLLLSERSIESACAKAGIDPSTAWRWMKNETFMKEYRQVRKGILENTISRIQSISLQAIDTLERNMSCENPAAEIRAAQLVLEHSIKGLEILDLEERIAYLEEILIHRENQV